MPSFSREADLARQARGASGSRGAWDARGSWRALQPEQSRGPRWAHFTFLPSETLQTRRPVLALWTHQTRSSWRPSWALVASWSRSSLLAFQTFSLHHGARDARRPCGPHVSLLSLGPGHARGSRSSLLSYLSVLPRESIQASLPLFSSSPFFTPFSLEARSSNISGRSGRSRQSLGSPHAHLTGQPGLPPHAFAAVSPRGTRQAQGPLLTLSSLDRRPSAHVAFLSLGPWSSSQPGGSRVALWAGGSHGAIRALFTLFSSWAGTVDGLQKSNLFTAGDRRWLGRGRGLCQHSLLARARGDVTACLQLCVSGVTVNHDALQVKVNGHAVVEALAEHSLALDVDVLSLLNGQRLHQCTVDIEGDILGLDAQGELVPVPVEEVVDPGTAEDHPDGVLHGAHSVVLHGLVLSVQPDGDLRDAVLVDDLPDMPVFFPGRFPDPEGGDKGVLVRQALREHILRPLYHREGPHPDIGALRSVLSLPQNLLHSEQVHQVKTCDFLGFSIGVLKAVSFHTDTGAEHVLTQAAPQLAPDLVDGVEVGHMEDVGSLGLRGHLLQLLPQGLPDAHGKDADARAAGSGCSTKYQVLAAAIGQEDGHLLEGTVPRAAASLRGEAVAGDEAQCVARVGIATVVGQQLRGRLDCFPRAQLAQLEGCGGLVAVVHDPHAGVFGSHLEGVHQVGHPPLHLPEVLLAHAGGRIQEEDQVVLNTFAACPLGLAAAARAPQQQHREEQGRRAPSWAGHSSLVLGDKHFLARKTASGSTGTFPGGSRAKGGQRGFESWVGSPGSSVSGKTPAQAAPSRGAPASNPSHPPSKQANSICRQDRW